MLTVTCIDRKTLALHQGKVVKLSTYSRLVAAQECVKRAEDDAAQIKAEAETAAVREKKRAYEDGIAQAQKEFVQLMAATALRLESAHLILENRLVNLVMQTLHTVLGTLDDALVLEKLVQQCIRAVGQEKRLFLRVSEEQQDAANKALSSILSSYPHLECIEVVADARLKKNSCVLETEYGAVDGSLEMHLAAIRQGLVETFAASRNAIGTQRAGATTSAGT
jgi:type III secretion protein L